MASSSERGERELKLTRAASVFSVVDCSVRGCCLDLASFVIVNVRGEASGKGDAHGMALRLISDIKRDGFWKSITESNIDGLQLLY